MMIDKVVGFKNKVVDTTMFRDYEARFYAYEIEFYPGAKASCICCLSSNSRVIEESWRDIMDDITNNYMLQGLSEFEMWNTYLVFFCHDQLEKEVQYAIENDKFSMRKLFIRIYDIDSSEESEFMLKSLLNKKLLLEDVSIDITSMENKDWLKSMSELSSRIWSAELTDSSSKEKVKQRRRWLEEEIERRVFSED